MKKSLRTIGLAAMVAAMAALWTFALTNDCIGDCQESCAGAGLCMESAAEGFFGRCECECSVVAAQLP